MASDACHLAGQCDPLSGNCSNPTAPDGTPCPGGACQSGICIASLPDMAKSADLLPPPADLLQPQGDLAQASSGDLGSSSSDLGNATDAATTSDLGPGGGGQSPDLGSSHGGKGGCGCVIGESATRTEVRGWQEAALLALVLVGLVFRRRRRSL
jgi:MYXO-CTERM domain-containing protein